MDDSPIVVLENIHFAYPERPPLFAGLSLALSRHDSIGLHGANGSGKTTLLRLIMGLETPLAGRICHHGETVDSPAALRRLRRNVGLVLQNSDDQLFSVTVLEDVAFGPLNLGLDRRAARDRALATLADLGLTRLAERSTHRLSVGEKKMVSIASVLSMRPEALLLDEPSASLDEAARERVVAVLRQLAIPRIVVSHDRDFLVRTTTQQAAMRGDGQLIPATTVVDGEDTNRPEKPGLPRA
ncbi:MAG: energy-coupling factor ABC transporter ATP-binding protein [Planctomycetes bacterium]|nr:energy-coupling factor ABC transporter ATP-binding protein [Planctomycetota bacterium]